MQTDGAARKAALERLEPLVGEWRIKASFPPTDMVGASVFEWMFDGQFVVQRSRVPHPQAPEGYSIFDVADAEAGTYTQHYFDSRGVVRIYAMTFGDGKWTLLRDRADFTPLPFAQRYTGEFADDGNAISGRWEISHDGGATWELDFDLTYTRVR